MGMKSPMTQYYPAKIRTRLRNVETLKMIRLEKGVDKKLLMRTILDLPPTSDL